MFKASLWAVLAAGVMMTVGCGTQSGGSPAAPAAKGGLAVIDLDLVGKTVGRTQEINELLQVRKNGLDQGLAKLQANFKDQLAKKKEEFGEQPTEEQQKILAAMNREATNKFLQIGRSAQADLEKYRQTLIGQFRAEMKPFAQEVAAAKGLSIVIPKNEGFLLSIDPAVDITSDVIDVYNTKKPAPTALKAPAPQTVTPAAPMPEEPAQTAEQPAEGVEQQ